MTHRTNKRNMFLTVCFEQWRALLEGWKRTLSCLSCESPLRRSFLMNMPLNPLLRPADAFLALSSLRNRSKIVRTLACLFLLHKRISSLDHFLAILVFRMFSKQPLKRYFQTDTYRYRSRQSSSQHRRSFHLHSAS